MTKGLMVGLALELKQGGAEDIVGVGKGIEARNDGVGIYTGMTLLGSVLRLVLRLKLKMVLGLVVGHV